jgi:hypothetical protein
MEEEGNLAVRAAVVAARVMEPIVARGENLSLLMHPTKEEALFQPRIEPVTNFVEKVWIRLSLLWKVKGGVTPQVTVLVVNASHLQPSLNRTPQRKRRRRPSFNCLHQEASED